MSNDLNTPQEIPSTSLSTVSETSKKPEQKSTSGWKRAFFGLLIAAVVLASAGVGAAGYWYYDTNNNPTASNVSSGEDGNKIVTQEESDIAAVAAKVSPSVVSITSSISSRSLYGTTSQEGAGTGIIVSTDGYVMTNNHVVEGASSVSIIDNEGNEYEDVKIIGRDPLNDVAFLKITADKTFDAVEIGDSSTVRIGQQVVAIGNALGQYENSVTSGILSGIGRPVVASSSNGDAEALLDLLQTDASINSGNSGGPLLNLAGQVIGINTAVATDANGIGFAIPINSTKGVLEGVIKNGTVSRSFLGVNFLSITPEIAREYKLDVNQGAYVYKDGTDASPVSSGSPGDKAGIKSKDIIQKVDDFTVGKQGGLSSILGQYQPGDKVVLTILRDGKSISVDVTLGSYKS